MKTGLYLILTVISLSLLSFTQEGKPKSTITTVNKKTEQAAPDSTQVSKHRNNPWTFRSGWLNEKNFPRLQQETNCPFYTYVKPGC
ncbi:MAG TPA: hypothetical protein PKG48_05250 [Bacteroidales bacterium]|nr:hypothetical protein [Bacteroidales bacterium]HPS63479.1 hypothetical protein [Bacteroidales bacterium]